MKTAATLIFGLLCLSCAAGLLHKPSFVAALNAVPPVAAPPAPSSEYVTNSDGITINNNANATPYPSTISFSASAGYTVTNIICGIEGLTHSRARAVFINLRDPNDIMVPVLGFQGGTAAINNIALVFDDSAGSTVPTPIVSGTYKVTPQFGSLQLSEFNGFSPTGTWSLEVWDGDLTFSSGTITKWWLRIQTTPP